MSPGASIRPRASMTRSPADGVSSPTAAIRSPLIRTLARRAGAPDPSRTFTLVMTVEGVCRAVAGQLTAARPAAAKNRPVAQDFLTAEATRLAAIGEPHRLD